MSIDFLNKRCHSDGHFRHICIFIRAIIVTASADLTVSIVWAKVITMADVVILHGGRDTLRGVIAGACQAYICQWIQDTIMLT